MNGRRRRQELERHVPPASGDDEDEEYLAVPDDRMELLAQSVALVKVARGADFTKLVSFSNSTSLYIDLNDATGAEEEFSVQGFNPKRVFFITLSKEVPLDVVSEVMGILYTLCVSTLCHSNVFGTA